MPHRIAGHGTERLAPSLSELFDGWIQQRHAQAQAAIEAHTQENGGDPPTPEALARALDPPASPAVGAYYLYIRSISP